MSGLCGIVALDGGPIDRDELQGLTPSLRYRGPDGLRMQVRDDFGFGHALLRTLEATQPALPLSLDGATWITCDARIDAQAQLKAKLAALGREASDAGDAELILHAYAAWGEDCVAHLLGDFSFAIWDARRKRLFCARDHFGVKPFFYAVANRRFVFSNTLKCVLAHPAVPRAHDEGAIADFLLFDMNRDPAGTAFAAVRRLPPAHCLVASAAGIQVRRYWELPDPGVTYRQAGEYVETFRQLLDAAVRDRLRCTRAGILMSGGLDSSAVAASATRAAGGAQLKAFSVVYDRLIADDERHFVGIAASALGIPLALRTGDDYALFERHAELGAFFPEPANKPFAAIEVDTAREAASHARVMLTGWDGDALITESPRPYFRSLLRQRRFARLLRGAFGYAASERKLLPAGTLARLNPWRPVPPPAAPRLPPWLSAEFATRLALHERAAARAAEARADPHPVRPYAYRALAYLQSMSDFFDGYDPGCTGAHVEFRHPLLDLRLVEFCLSLPPYPWCVRKAILRAAMRGRLPEAIRCRPKTPLGGYPYLELLQRDGARWSSRFSGASAVWNYIDKARMDSLWRETDPDAAWTNLRPLALHLWLRHSEFPALRHKEQHDAFA